MVCNDDDFLETNTILICCVAIVHKKRRRHHKNHGSCRHQHIQSCTWPQCNNSCPKLQNPATGKTVKSIAYKIK